MYKRFLSILLTVAMIIVPLSAAAPKAYADTSTGTQKSSDFVIEPTEIECTGVYNRSGYAVVSSPNPDEEYYYYEYYGLADRDGKYIIAAKASDNYPRYDIFGDTFFISDGIILDYKYGHYYKLDGTRAFDFDNDNAYLSMRTAMPFYNGRALVQHSEGSPYYIIDPEGNVLKEMEKYTGGWVYAGEGFTLSTNFADQVVYYDYEGNVIIDLKDRGYSPYAGPFFEGHAWVRNAETGLVGFIDETGAEVIPCEYEDVSGFNCGLATIYKDRLAGCINASNELVIPVKYDNAFGFAEGLAAVKMDGKWGVVDYNENEVIPFEYDDISSFLEGVAYAVKDGLLYTIKEAGCATYNGATLSLKDKISVNVYI